LVELEMPDHSNCPNNSVALITAHSRHGGPATGPILTRPGQWRQNFASLPDTIVFPDRSSAIPNPSSAFSSCRFLLQMGSGKSAANDKRPSEGGPRSKRNCP
jgi:hypothetical protein